MIAPVSITIPLDHHDAAIALSLFQKLQDMHAKQSYRLMQREQNKGQPPTDEQSESTRDCADWCEDDGQHSHGDACWSESEYVDFSLMPVLGEDGVVFPQRLGVMARLTPDEPAHVYVHLDSIAVSGPVPSPYDYLDQSLHLTADEARRLASALIREADRIDT